MKYTKSKTSSQAPVVAKGNGKEKIGITATRPGLQEKGMPRVPVVDEGAPIQNQDSAEAPIAAEFLPIQGQDNAGVKSKRKASTAAKMTESVKGKFDSGLKLKEREKSQVHENRLTEHIGVQTRRSKILLEASSTSNYKINTTAKDFEISKKRQWNIESGGERNLRASHIYAQEMRDKLFTVPKLQALYMDPHFGRIPSMLLPHGSIALTTAKICNAVAVARLLNATLILPVLVQDLVWKRWRREKFEDVYDVGHFIDYLKDDVRIIREIPGWIVKKDALYGSQRIVRNIPKYASSQYYIDNVLPMIKTKKILSLKPFTDRLGHSNVPQEINRLRCRVNYHALRFIPEVEKMADTLVSRMRMRTGRRIPFIALHLRYEKGMIGLSFCDFVGTREEKEMMDAYRKKLWPRRYNNGSHLWKLALEKRKSGKCPLEPGEIAMLLRALGYESNTQIYIASGPIYGGDNKLAPLRNMFPNQIRKEELVAKGELDRLKKHVTNLAALDFLVCLKSDVFVSTHGGNFAKLIIGARRTVLTRDQTPTPTRREARMMDGLKSISKDGIEHRQEKAQCPAKKGYSTVTLTTEFPNLERGGGVRNVLNA
ncbi:hypothetical protein J5N97_003888 [Dioscorea zingiberensis]|uniref:O-fucosyltransferase family protein n=1 Tax=Dioscorea zingiberensis TaxID=325984 RepID=A0A9D5HRL7_9LILI|nr:hypothetical protein J5N97_003888 [Dioscorea zingiberensis]